MSIVQTSCEKCLFAKYNKLGAQIGCELSRLDKFSDKKLINDSNTKMYFIINRLCNTYRTEEHLAKKPDLKETIMDDVAIDYGAIVVIENNFNFADITYTLLSLNRQKINARQIVIVFNKDGMVSKEYSQALKNVSDINLYFTNVLTDTDLVDEAVPKCDNQYYVALKQGEGLDIDASERVNNALNVDLKQFLMAKVGKHTFVLRLAHDIYEGNKKYRIEEKLQDVADKTNRQDLILEL